MKQVSTKTIGVIIALTLGVILAFSPINKKAKQNLNVSEIADEIIQRNDHITAEQLGQLIIDKDPGYQLIDLRDTAEYEKFHIPSSSNIPLQKLFLEENMELIDPEKLVVLYSNGGTHAAQAWVLLQQKGFTNTTVLLGGLNYWVDVYSNPTPPEGVYADSEIFNYQFRVSAGNYLMGNVKAEDTQADAPPVKPIKLPTRKKKAKKGDEGC